MSVNLKGYYPFNGNANDVSGNGYNGVVVGAVLTTDRFDNINSAYFFDGVTKITINNVLSTITQEFSISMRVFVSIINRPAGQSLFLSSNNKTGVLINPSGMMTGFVDNGAIISTPNFDLHTISADILNKWNLFTLTYKSNVLKLYLNGNVIGQVAVSGTILGTTNIILGNGTTVQGLTNGKIDDVNIWNKELTQSDVQYILTNTLLPIATNVLITGGRDVGNVLTITYTYNGILTAGTPIYSWYNGANLLSGEVGNTYVVKGTDRGYDITARVQPTNSIGDIGAEVISNIIQIKLYSQSGVLDKTYQIKLYTRDGVFKRAVNQSILMNDIKFTSQINGGQGECVLQLRLQINNDWFEKSDVIKISCFDGNNTEGRLIYTGSISRIRRNIKGDGEYIELSCIGLFALMGRTLFNQGGYVFNKNQDPALTIKNIITDFNVSYPYPTLTTTDVNTYGSNVSIDFAYKKSNEGISGIQKITRSWWFYIGADGAVKYKHLDLPGTTHRLKLENQVDSVSIDEQIETLTNKIIVQYGDGLIGGPYEDVISKNLYGVNENTVTASLITDIDGANIYGEQYLLKNKDQKKQIKVVVNNRYDIESIVPGDIIVLLNTDYVIDKLQVQRIDYAFDKVTLDLNKYETFAETILSDNYD